MSILAIGIQRNCRASVKESMVFSKTILLEVKCDIFKLRRIGTLFSLSGVLDKFWRYSKYVMKIIGMKTTSSKDMSPS